MAVDPKVIPLQSVVIIGGHFYLAQDTGSAVRGQVIDVYHAGHEAARRFGRREVLVQVIEPGQECYDLLRRYILVRLLAQFQLGIRGPRHS